MRRAPLRLLLGPVMVIAGAILLVNLIVLVTWTAPRFTARFGVTGTVASVADARQRIEPALRAAQVTYGRLSDADDELDALRRVVVTDVGAARLLSMLDTAGDDVGIDLDDATLQYVPIPELGIVQLGITFPVTGTYEAVRHLLDELVALPVFLVVDGVGLQSFNAASVAARRGGRQTIRVDLAISVFLHDPELTAEDAAGAPPARPVVPPQRIEALRDALASGSPTDIADEVLAALAALPPLPVDPTALELDLEQLDTPVIGAAPRRNLFSVVLPPAPPPPVVEQPEVFVEPVPVLPVRLLGVVRIDGRWHASLADSERLWVVAAGATLPNGVEVIDVGRDYAELDYQNERTVLRLEGNRP